MTISQNPVAHPLDGSVAELLWLLPLLPLLGSLINGALVLIPRLIGSSNANLTLNEREALAGRRMASSKWITSVVGPGVMLAAFVLSVLILFSFIGAGDVTSPFVRTYASWMPAGSLVIDWGLQLDQLSMVMALVITGVGFLIHVFSIGYMSQDSGYSRYFAYLNLFVSAMLILVLGSGYAVMFVGWEGVGLASYLLIGFWFDSKANADAGKKAFIVNRIGDFGFLVAIFMLFSATGVLDFVGVHSGLSGSTSAFLTAVALALFVGCAGKSAQLPLYIWLPDAMAGPTPVSALIHAATMVTAGIYLVVRAAPIFSGAPEVSLFIALIGVVTALFAATIALRQWDIKKVLAYSTVSQLGYMFVAVGTGVYAAGIFHLVTHAFFKALLFLGAGAVIHAMHEAYHRSHQHDQDAQDLRNMGGLRRHMPITAGLMWIATLAIAGIPPLSGFFSKDEILAGVFARAQESTLASASIGGVSGASILYVIYGLGLLTAFLTALYMTRLMILAFTGKNRTGIHAEQSLHEVPRVMTIPMLVLGVLTVIGGWLNLPAILPIGKLHVLSDWLAPVTSDSVSRLGGPVHLSHSTEIVLIGVAVFTAVAGIALAFALFRRPVLNKDASPSETGLALFLAEAWRVDSAVDKSIVKPLRAFSEKVVWKGLDQQLDRALVAGSQLLSRVSGQTHDTIGAGDTGRYAWVIALGVIVVLAAFILP